MKITFKTKTSRVILLLLLFFAIAFCKIDALANETPKSNLNALVSWNYYLHYIIFFSSRSSPGLMWLTAQASKSAKETKWKSNLKRLTCPSIEIKRKKYATNRVHSKNIQNYSVYKINKKVRAQLESFFLLSLPNDESGSDDTMDKVTEVC